MRRALLTLLLLSTVVAANYLTSHYGLVPVGFGLTATAGTYLAGLAFIARDSLQDETGRTYTIAAIGAGAVLSYLVSDPFIALASGIAFFVSEIADLAVYTPLRDHGYLRAATASNIVGAFIDTVLFLWVAGFPVWSSVLGQMVGKLTLTLAMVLAVTATRALLRHPQRISSP